MNEIEFAELWFMAIQNSYNNQVMMVTSIFAYLIAGHLAGAALSKPLAVGLTSIYSIYSFSVLSTLLGTMVHLKEISSGYYQSFPNGYAVPSLEAFSLGVLLLVVATPIVLLWIGSIYYVHSSVRRSGT